MSATQRQEAEDVVGRGLARPGLCAGAKAGGPLGVGAPMSPDRIRVLKFLGVFHVGGTERNVVDVSQRLDASKFELHLACFGREGQLLKDIEARQIPLAEYRIDSLHNYRTLRAQLRLAKDLRRKAIQVVHTYNFYANVFAIPAARLAGTPVIVASIYDIGAYLTPMKRRVQRLICHLADYVIANAEAVRQWLIAEGYRADRIAVIRNGIDVSRFQARGKRGALHLELGLTPDVPLVAVLSRLDAVKGIQYFLEAAVVVAERSPRARFVVMGDGPYRGELERHAARLGLGGRVVFTGLRLDVPEILPDVAVSVLPSLSEGLPNTLLESMATGVPVVATSVGGNGEAVEEGVTGLLVPPRDAGALARAIGLLLENAELAERFGQAGRRRAVERFSVERMVRETENFYLTLANPTPKLKGRRHPESPSALPVAPRASKSMLERIQDPTAFEGLRSEWNELLGASAADCVFLTWEWLYTWWKHLGGRRQLSLIAVRRGGELVAMAPLALTPPVLMRPFPSLEFLGTGSVGSDYLDVIVRRGSEVEALPVLAEHLARANAVLELGQLNRDSPMANCLASELLRWGWRGSETTTDLCPVISLAGHSWESYLATLGPEHRYNFRRRLRALDRFDVRFEPVASEDERREALATLVTMHQLRWRGHGHGHSNAFHTSRLLAFHEEFTRIAQERGWLRLFVLSLDGRAVAALYGLRYGRTFYFYQSGFDPAYGKLSVGLVTMGLAIKSALEEGADEYDLLHGAEPYKFHWAQHARQLVGLELYPPHGRGSLYRHAAGLSRAARRVARRVLPNGVVDRIATGVRSWSLRTE